MDAQTKPRDASEQTRETVTKILIAHNLFLRGDKTGKRGALRFFDLAEWELVKINLARADLTGISLAGAKLRQADLRNACLFMADLERADLTGANLSGADLRGARLRGAILDEARLEGANLGASELTEPLTDSNGYSVADPGRQITDMSSASLQSAVLLRANMQECDLSGADLSGADASGADLSGAVLVNATLVDLRADGTSFQGANTFGAEFSDDLADVLKAQTFNFGSDGGPDVEALIAAHHAWVASGGEEGKLLEAEKMDFSGRDLRGMNLSFARLRQCDFSRARLEEARFLLADVTGSNFTGAAMKGADMSGAIMRRCNLDGVDFRSAQFGDAELPGSTDKQPALLERSQMRHTNFDGANLTRTVMRDAVITQDTLQSLANAGVPPMVLRKMQVVADKT